MKTYAELKWRGLIEQITSPKIEELLDSAEVSFYIGFDPTATSFHVGQLVVFNIMRILQSKGHKPIALMGVATGMIGDPSGKDKERNLLDFKVINQNIQNLKQQFELMLDSQKDHSKFLLVNNYDWISKLDVISFLRDIGKHFSVSQMLTKDSVASRLNREGEGITYTEFSYMLLQAYDFLHLSKTHNCILQIGGSDQWSNILSGIDLNRRLLQKEVYGLTTPLLIKKDGQKFGKSEGGAVWIDSDLTSPYQFYQFFLRQADEDTPKLLKMLTDIPPDEIQYLQDCILKAPEKREAQKKLATHLTLMVHGNTNLQKCELATQALYGGDLLDLDVDLLGQVFSEVPSYFVPLDLLQQGWSPLDMLVQIGACTSKGEARTLIKGKGLYLNNKSYTQFDNIGPDSLLANKIMIVRKGKKQYFLIKTKE